MKKNGFISILVFVVLAMAAPHVVHAATFTVNNTEDINDMNPGDGVCSTAAGTCTLRAAIQESNALGSIAINQIKLPTGIYKLELGALKIFDSLVLDGDGADFTTIDGQLQDRVFYIEGVRSSTNVNISGVTIKNGEPPSNFSPGGGIYSVKGSLSIHNSNVSNNKARIWGAGISNAGVLRLFQSTVRDNEITGLTTGGGFTANGGGIFNFSSGTVEINRSTVSGNRATRGGGIYNYGHLEITNSTISGNEAFAGGGGIRNESGTAFIAFSTITNNVANLSAPDENVAKRTGGGIQNLGTVSVGNTILSGNNDNRVPSDSFFSPDCFSPTQVFDGSSYLDGTFTSFGGNLVGITNNNCNIGDTSFDIVGMDPRLGPLADNGGPTKTHALLKSPFVSPAIDKGNGISNAPSSFNCPATDQRGAHRPVDGDGDEIKHCDIGAFEHGGYYVGKQGSDANTCTQAQSFSTPKLTISNGASCLKPGDTLFVQAGLYAEPLLNVIPLGTSNFSPVTVMAFPGHIVTIRPATGVSGVLTFIGPDQAYGVIDGMIVDCVNASNDCVSIQDGAHHIKIKNSELKNSPGVGVLGGINSEFSNLNVHHHKGHGFRFDQPNNVIYFSVINDNGSHGIRLISNATTTQIYNNTISNNSGYGIVVGADVSGTVIMNNIISSNVEGAINNAGTGTIVNNNLN